MLLKYWLTAAILFGAAFCIREAVNQYREIQRLKDEREWDKATIEMLQSLMNKKPEDKNNG